MPNPSKKLVHTLIAKSIIETLLVGGLAVFAFITLFPPYFHGWGEVTDGAIVGWAVNNAEPWQRVQVQLFIDGQFVATGIAESSRPDVSAAGWAKDEWHGYQFPMPALPVGRHEARIYALHDSVGEKKSLQMLGDPLMFGVEPGGKIVKVSGNK
jgi:hypothetical protein